MQIQTIRHALGFTMAAILFFTASSLVGAQPATRPAAPAPSAENYAAERSRLVSEDSEIIAILENGLTVIARRVPSPVVSVRAYVKTGGVYEGEWLGGGLSHLLEHLVAGGSTEHRTEAENRTLLQEIGNNSNAYTAPDRTAYFVNTTADNLEKAVDLVTGWVFWAKITPEEYAREYEVVQRELEKNQGEPDRVFYYQVLHNRYRVSPARVPTIGYQSVIQRLTRDDVYTYYKLAYQPNNMIIAIAGDVDPQRMLSAVQQHVASVPPGRGFSHDIPAEPPVVSPRTEVSTFPQLGQAKLQLAFPTIQLSDPDLYALDLLATILADGESSILVQELRDRRQLVSSISAGSYTPDYVAGTFSVNMELETGKIPDATRAVFEQIRRIQDNGVSAQRLERAKTQTRTARAFSQQTSAAMAESMAIDLMTTGDPHFTDRYVERMQQVTAAQVQAMAKKYLDQSVLLTTAMLPAEAVPSGLAEAEALVRAATPTTAPAAEKQSASQIVHKELPDGTTLLLKRMTNSPVVSIQMYALGGTSVEDAATNGLGNLAMLSARRGTTSRSAEQIAEFFDSIGGDFSTAGGNNTWSWNATFMKEDLPGVMQVFADVVFNPSFPDEQVEQIRRRVLAAIESQDAHWFTQSMRFFRASYFGPMDSPYQFLPVGTRQSVASFTPQQVRQWYAEKVLTAPRVLAIFGDIDLAQAEALARQQFAGGHPVPQPLPAATQPLQPPATAPVGDAPSILVRKVEVSPSGNPQAGVFIGFDSASFVGSPTLPALTVGDTMASGYGYPTGYLFETLRGQGLVYDVQAFVMPGRSASLPGAFIVYAVCDPKNVDAVVEAALQNIARLQGTPQDMQPAWFDRAKQLIVTSDAMQNETPAEQAITAAIDELFGLGYDYHSAFADKIEQVAISQVQNTSRRLLDSCVITVTTPDPSAVSQAPGRRTWQQFPPVDLTPRGVQHDAQAK